MSKPSRRLRKPATTAPVARPVILGSLFLGIRRAIFDGSFARAVAGKETETKSSESTGTAPSVAKVVDFFAPATRLNSPTDETQEG